LQAQTGTATIVINPLPTVTITGATTVCQNAASPIITLTGANGTAPYTFIYKLNGGANQAITTTTGNAVIITAPTSATGTFTYSLVSVQDATGCIRNTTPGAVITVQVLPTASISGTTTTCQNLSTPLITLTGANGTLPYTFTYQVNGGANQAISTSTISSSVTVPVSTAVAGSYTYTLVSVTDGARYRVQMLKVVPQQLLLILCLLLPSPVPLQFVKMLHRQLSRLRPQTVLHPILSLINR
jgi:hypothetical protein